MADPDFLGLRGETEEIIRQPDFEMIQRRATRRRRRSQVITTVASCCTALLMVGAMVSMTPHRPEFRLDPDAKPTATPSNPEPIVQARQKVVVHAVTGTGQGAYFAATDLCTTTTTMTTTATTATSLCRLRIVRFGRQQRVLADDLLRRSPDVSLTGIRLTALSDQWLLITATTGTGSAVTAKVATDDGRIGSVQRSEPGASPGPQDRMVQLAAEDAPCAVDPTAAVVTCAADARIVRRPTVAYGIPHEYGWWITGLDPRTSNLAVSVSHDRGAGWTTAGLGLPFPPDSLALATEDAHTAHLFVNTGARLVELVTTDGGGTWNQATFDLPLPKELREAGALYGVPVGAIVRPDRSILFWLDWEQRTNYFSSADGGRTFFPTSSLGGPITQVPDGYLAVTGPTVLFASDARTWTTVMDTADPWVTPS